VCIQKAAEVTTFGTYFFEDLGKIIIVHLVQLPVKCEKTILEGSIRIRTGYNRYQDFPLSLSGTGYLRSIASAEAGCTWK
jgi:hypothetical protein